MDYRILNVCTVVNALETEPASAVCWCNAQPTELYPTMFISVLVQFLIHVIVIKILP